MHKVHDHFNMQKGKSNNTPLLAYLKPNKDDCPNFDVKKDDMAKIPCTSSCGSLMYAMVATRLDITFAIVVVNRYMSHPRKKH